MSENQYCVEEEINEECPCCGWHSDHIEDYSASCENEACPVISFNPNVPRKTLVEKNE